MNIFCINNLEYFELEILILKKIKILNNKFSVL